MYLFLLLLIAVVGLITGFFIGWYMADKYLIEPTFGAPDDADKFYMDEKLSKYKADDHE